MKKSLLGMLLFLAAASFSYSWEKGKVGLNMRFDPSPRVGMTFHVSERFMLRPYVGFSRETEEAESDVRPLPGLPVIRGERNTETTSLGFGIGAFFSLYTGHDFTVYTGLQFHYARVSTEISSSWLKEKIEETGERYQPSILVGLQCRLTEHLAAFGEAGAGYASGGFDRENDTEVEVNTTRWGLLNAGVGVVFYF